MADAAPNLPVFELDDDGLLKNPQQWNETVAREIARQLDIAELTTSIGKSFARCVSITKNSASRRR